MIRRRGTQHGYTLLEVLIVTVITSALFGAVIVMLSGLLRGQSAAAEQLMQVRTLSRLDEQFRRDVRGATSAEISQDANTLTLTLSGDRTIIYLASTRRVTRTEREGEQIARREEYTWEAATIARWYKLEDGPEESRQVKVSLSFDSLEQDAPHVAWEALGTTVVLGSDERFLVRAVAASTPSEAEDAP